MEMVDHTERIIERIGRYQIQAEIGRGGSGIIYRAYEETLHRTVALKVLSPNLAGQANLVMRLRHEAISAARLRHPNIALLYELGQEAGQAFLAMEYIPGRSLREIIEEGPLSYARTIHILKQIGEALDYAHSIKVIHRDIKPSNILVQADDHAVLVDFGLAYTADNSLITPDGVVLGTPHYMSPEQAAGREPDAQSDQYSLAAVAYEMLTGVSPFDYNNTAAVIHAHIYEFPPPPTENNPALPIATTPVLLKALSKAPHERYASLQAFIADLDAALAPPTPIQSARRRKRFWMISATAFFSSAAVLALLLVNGLIELPLGQNTFHKTPFPQQVAWNYEPDFVGGAVLAAGNKYLVVSNPNGRLTVLNAGDGKVIWQTNEQETWYSAPSVNDSLIFVGGQIESVDGLSLVTGGTVWTTKVIGKVELPPVQFQNSLVAVTSKGYVYVLNAGNGRVIWSRPFMAGIESIETAPGNLLITTSSSLYALDINGGTVKWEYKISSTITTRPVVVANLVIIGTEEGLLHMVNLTDGIEQWHYQAKGSIKAAPVVRDQIMYVPDQSGRLLALSLERKSILWEYYAGSSLESTPLLYNNYVVVGADNGKIIILQARDGRKELEIQFNASIKTAPVQSNGKIFIRADEVYALQP